MQETTIIEFVDWFVARFNKDLEDCPIVHDRYYNTFDHTRTGQNTCHPRTLGLLARICWCIPGVAAVDVDMRFNVGEGVKFQPDLVAVDSRVQPLLIVEFESPNSSDARIPSKDVQTYIDWADSTTQHPPYLVVTSLPSKPGRKLQRKRKRGVRQIEPV